MKHAARILVLCLLAVLAACSASDSRGGRLLGAEEQPTPDEEMDRLHKMMAVSVISIESGGQEAGVVKEWSIDRFTMSGLTLGNFCTTRFPDCTAPSITCSTQVACLQRLNLCGAESFWAISKDEPLNITLDDPDDAAKLPEERRKYKLLPQTTATKAALAAEAIESAFRGAASALLSLASLSGNCPSDTQAARDAAVQELANQAVENFYIMRGAEKTLVRAVMAVSDAERSSSPSRGVVLARSVAQPYLSRSALAHYLLGGWFTTKPAPVLNFGFCDATLSGPAQSALKVFREAGVAPDDVLNTALTTPKLVNGSTVAGSTTEVQNGSVRERLSAFWGVPITPDTGVESYYRLRLSDFEDARRYLSQELVAFARARKAKQDPPIVNGVPAAYARYSAVANAPPDRDPAYFSALTLQDCGDKYCGCGTPGGGCASFGRLGGNGPPQSTIPALGGTGEAFRWHPDAQPTATVPPRGYSYAAKLDWVYSTVDQVLRLVDSLPGTAKKTVPGPLERIQEHASERPARLVHCSGGGLAEEFRLNGVAATTNTLLVRGERVLEYLTKLTIEGQRPSALEAVTPLPPDVLGGFGTAATPDYGFTVASKTAPIALPTVPERWYVLRSAGNSWEVLGGFVPYAQSSTTRKCRDIPFIPNLNQQVKLALAPDRKDCSAARIPCVADPNLSGFDERLPLEDELSADQDDVESSWKHYLELADQAAKEADLLGQDYLQAAVDADRNQLDIELRRQGQEEKAAVKLEELQEICGTTIDIAPLLDFLRETAAKKQAIVSESVSNFSLADLDLGLCREDNDPLTICVSGRLTLDWLQVATLDPRLAELRRCVSSISDIGRVHLGTRTVCVKPGGANLCGGISPGELCPELATNDTCPSGWEPVREGLKYFDTDKTLPPLPTTTQCGAIRRLRQDATDAEGNKLLPNLVQSNTLSPDQLVKDLNFEARYWTHGAIRRGESVKWATGDPRSGGQSGSWPCTGAPVPSGCKKLCPAGDPTPECVKAGLFCQVRDCTNELERADIMPRIINAVAIAQLAQVKDGGVAPHMTLPVLVPSYWRDPHSETMTVSKVVGSTPVNTHAIAAHFPELGEVYSNVHVDGKTFTVTNISSGDPATNAWRLSNNGAVFNVVTPPAGKVLAFIDAPIGSIVGRVTIDEGQTVVMYGGEAVVPYDPTLTLYAGIWNAQQGANGYFIDVLNGGRARTITKIPADYKVFLPTWVQGMPLESVLPNLVPAKSPENLLDGLELLCEANSSEDSFNTASCGTPPPATKDLASLPAVSRYLNCVGQSIQRRGALTVFDNFPKEARDALRRTSPVGSHDSLTGTIGKQYSDLRVALLDVAAAAPGIGREISGLARDLRDLQLTLAINENDKDIDEIKFWSTVADQIANCADATANAQNVISFGVHSAVVCANSIAQIGFASEINRLARKNTDNRNALAENNFNERFATRVDTLEDLSTRLTRATEIVDGALIEGQNSRAAAQRTLGEAVWLLSNEAKSQATLSAVLGKKKELAQGRYQRALENAKLMSFLAKRAIEQRLGVKLADMNNPLPLVAAPSTWEGKVCALSGIDYAKLANEGTNVSADAFIGEYVQNLKNLIESYRLEYNFHEGSDTAVISLRDDIDNVRASCEVESTNLLYNSARLDLTREGFTPNAPSWFPDGCLTTTSGGVTFNAPDCVVAGKSDQRPFISAALEERSVPAFGLRFGPGCRVPATCGLVEQLTLPAGLYRFSWYTPDTSATSQSAQAGSVRTMAGAELKPPPLDTTRNGFVTGTATTWSRPYFLFELTDQTEVKVGFRSPNTSAQQFTIAAPMLELVNNSGGSVTRDPKAFMVTHDSRKVMLPYCEDTDGKVFRVSQWKRQCVKLCANGFAAECPGDDTQTSCYRETTFSINQRGIESGNAFVESGFARGNFNYRIDSIGLNFVGTGIRNCSDDPLASTCNAAGYVTYSLEHQGPYYVRNHFGDDFEAKLFPGHIEHARGLGNERYLTNPLSSADGDLIESYLRSEFKGRPLDGNFVLRVWEEPGLNFDAIRDVQILLKYRYWTRFQ